MIIFTAIRYEEQIKILTHKEAPKIYTYPSGLLYSCPSFTPGVLFTFDGGPTHDTSKILDILDSVNISALFFMTKNHSDLYPEVVRRIANKTNDHELGSAGYNDSNILEVFSNQTVDHFTNMIRTTEGELANITDIWKPPKFYRPPGGAIDKLLLDSVAKLDYTTMLWNMRMHDIDTSNKIGLSEPRNGIVRLIDGDPETIKFLESLVTKGVVKQVDNNRFPWPILTPKQCCPELK